MTALRIVVRLKEPWATRRTLRPKLIGPMRSAQAKRMRVPRCRPWAADSWLSSGRASVVWEGPDVVMARAVGTAAEDSSTVPGAIAARGTFHVSVRRVRSAR